MCEVPRVWLPACWPRALAMGLVLRWATGALLLSPHILGAEDRPQIVVKDAASTDDVAAEDVCHPSSQEACNVAEKQTAAVVSQLVEEGKAVASRAATREDWLQALAVFKKALEIDNASAFAAPAEVNSAIVLRRLGDHDAASARLRHAVQLDPKLFYAHYNLGNYYKDAKAWSEGDRSYSRALELADSVHLQATVRTNWANLLYRAHHHSSDGGLAFQGRDLIDEAHSHLKAVQKATDRPGGPPPMRESVTTLSHILTMRGKHKERKKLHKWAVKKGLWKDPRQRPENFNEEFARAFDAEPWWDDHASEPLLATVQKRWKELQKEAEHLLGSGALHPVGERVPHDRELYNPESGEWKEHAVISHGQEEAQKQKAAPVARSLFQGADRIIGEPTAQVVYSVLLPGSKVLPHCGPSNEVITCHLGLRIPKSARGDNETLGISVGGETRQWREGEWMCFEDSFEHKAWNYGKSARVVLLVTMRHPRRLP